MACGAGGAREAMTRFFLLVIIIITIIIIIMTIVMVFLRGCGWA